MNGTGSKTWRMFQSFGKFCMNEHGLFVHKGGKGAADVKVSAPFEVCGRVRSPDGTGWARLIRFRDEDGTTRTAPVCDADLHSEPRNLAAHLAGLGLQITRGCAHHLADYLSETTPKSRITLVTRTGWHDVKGKRCFVLPTCALGDPMARPSYSKEAPDRSQPGATSRIGRRPSADWCRATVAACSWSRLPCRRRCWRLRDLMGEACTLSEVHRAASRPYSKLPLPAGAGALSMDLRTWRATANALEGTAAYHNDVALPLDELGVVDPRDAAAAVYQLAGGQGKGRSRKDGSLRESQTWRVMILSTGEVRLADKIVEGRQRAMAGQMVRLLDVPADAGKGAGAFDGVGTFQSPKVLSDSIKQAARSHYGTAGPAFVEAILREGAEDLSAHLLEHMTRFREFVLPAGADGQIQRAADRFGFIAAAGEFATALEIVPWQPGTSRNAAEISFRAWLDTRGGHEPHEVLSAISQVRDFIERHGDARFEPLEDTSRRPVPNRAGYRRNRGRDLQWLVSPEVWKGEVAAGFNPSDVARWLSDRGMQLRAADGFASVVKVDGRPQRFYILTARLLEDPLVLGDCNEG